VSFWDKVKSFFGAGGAAGSGGAAPGDLSGHAPELVREVSGVVKVRCARGDHFVAVDIADEVTRSNAQRGVKEIRAACAVVEALHDGGHLEALGYGRAEGGIYHPVGKAPAMPPPSWAPPARPGAPAPPARQQPAPAAVIPLPSAPAPRSRQPAAPDPLAAGEILGLTPAQMRERALKINPYKTAWIGRVDTIPPQSDERTALIDRGLLLRGLLTPKQLEEIHRVGDLWLRHHEAVRLAEIAAEKTADAALEARRAQRAALKEQKKRQAAERAAQRAAEVARRRAEDIIFLGRGVSARLGDRRAHIEELERRGLPLLATPADVATALGLTIKRLRWLAYHADAPTRPHYVYFEVPKRTGGTRLLSAPHDDLKKAQRWILESILETLPVTAAAHGFVPDRSVVTNARAHVGRDVVVNCDLKDFFPTITFPRVRGVFEAIGYSPAVATVLALLCTEAPRSRVEMEGRSYWVAVGPRALPQGAPTSPALSNQIARKLDQRLSGVCAKLGWTYTRYADDLTFSAPPGKRENIPWLLARVRHIAKDEGFRLNPKKCRVQRAARRQEVTGVVVNEKPSLAREELRRLRAILHAAKSGGLAAQNREGHPDFEAWLRGKIAYVAMIDREKGQRLLAELEALGG
jgi:retron-type reverse transcriptase